MQTDLSEVSGGLPFRAENAEQVVVVIAPVAVLSLADDALLDHAHLLQRPPLAGVVDRRIRLDTIGVGGSEEVVDQLPLSLGSVAPSPE